MDIRELDERLEGSIATFEEFIDQCKEHSNNAETLNKDHLAAIDETKRLHEIRFKEADESFAERINIMDSKLGSVEEILSHYNVRIERLDRLEEEIKTFQDSFKEETEAWEKSLIEANAQWETSIEENDKERYGNFRKELIQQKESWNKQIADFQMKTLMDVSTLKTNLADFTQKYYQKYDENLEMHKKTTNKINILFGTNVVFLGLVIYILIGR